MWLSSGLWAGAACLFALSLVLFARGLGSLRFLHKQAPNSDDPQPDDQLPFITLLLPVLREQSAIADTLAHFARLDYPKQRLRVVIVTTEREEAERSRCLEQIEAIARMLREGAAPEDVTAQFPGLGAPSVVTPVLSRMLAADPAALRQALASIPSTWACAAARVDELNASLGEPVFRRIHYPFTRGVMAHQINYATRYLFEVVDEGIDPDRLYVGVYNADSRPDPHTLRALAAMYRADPSGTIAAQQYSAYRLATSEMGPLSALVLHAAALWQTRWALTVEMERARRTSRLLAAPPDTRASPLKLLFMLPFNYAIGHGLFVRLRELVLQNYFPESTPNEDAPFGYFLLLAKIPLRPLPCLDEGEVPRNIRSLVAQQAGWFRGPFQAPTYVRLARRRRLTERAGRLLSTVLAFRVARDALGWVVGPAFFVATILVATFVDRACQAALLGAFAAYFILPSLPAAYLYKRRSTRARPSVLCGLLGMPLFYILHGIAPLYGMVLWARDAVRGVASPKYKTER
jgi:cellulose synthase/poly-beta-1,6-N-acetylglucosamine synthase-like glycosyltransferase